MNGPIVLDGGIAIGGLILPGGCGSLPFLERRRPVLDIARSLGDDLIRLGEQNAFEGGCALHDLGGVERGAGDQVDSR